MTSVCFVREAWATVPANQVSKIVNPIREDFNFKVVFWMEGVGDERGEEPLAFLTIGSISSTNGADSRSSGGAPLRTRSDVLGGEESFYDYLKEW